MLIYHFPIESNSLNVAFSSTLKLKAVCLKSYNAVQVNQMFVSPHVHPVTVVRARLPQTVQAFPGFSGIFRPRYSGNIAPPKQTVLPAPSHGTDDRPPPRVYADVVLKPNVRLR